MDELKQVKMLSPEEEGRLWRAYKTGGDEKSRARLIESYQPLVFKAALRFRVNESVLLDIIQEGTIGLIEAVERYDHTRGVAFSLFAYHRVRGRMLSYIEREGEKEHASIDVSVYDAEGQVTLGDLIEDTAPLAAEVAEQNVLLAEVKQAMERLPAKEQLVLSGVYLDDREPKRLAEEMNLSPSHIYRLQKQGIRRVRGMLSRFINQWRS